MVGDKLNILSVSTMNIETKKIGKVTTKAPYLQNINKGDSVYSTEKKVENIQKGQKDPKLTSVSTRN